MLGPRRATCGCLALLVSFLPLSLGTRATLSAREVVQQQSSQTAAARASLDPSRIEIALPPGEEIIEEKHIRLSGPAPELDVLFAFDLTGSMTEEADSLKLNALELLDRLSELASSVRFGLITFQDYDGNFTTSTAKGHPCDYTPPPFGYGGDPYDPSKTPFVYRADQPLTLNARAVSDAIREMKVETVGGDWPEAYSRALFEAVAELVDTPHSEFGPLGWREGARKIIVMYGDNLPHDCDLWGEAGVSPYPRNPSLTRRLDYGLDPGRDATIGTDDDLRILDVLGRLDRVQVSVVFIYSGRPGEGRLWDHYVERTGGTSYLINADGTFPDGTNVVDGITGLVGSTVAHVNELRLEICPEFGDYGGWIHSLTPDNHKDFDLPAVRSFELALGPPEGTDPGTYRFDICAIGDGAEFARQHVKITVPEGSSPRESKPGTLLVRIEKGTRTRASDVILVLDASRSMWGRVDGRPKIEIARDVMARVIEELPADRKVGLRAYGHRIRPGRPEACEDSELLVPVGPLDRQELRDAVMGLQPRGTTPIAGTLRKVASDFSAGEGRRERLVVLVSDGKEECGGDPSAAVRELKEAGINPRIEVVGFALADQATRQEMEEIAALTGGRFHDARNPKELQRSLTVALGVPFRVLDADGNVVARGTTGSAVELPAGVYRVIVELPGREPVEAREVQIRPNGETTIRVRGDTISVTGTV